MNAPSASQMCQHERVSARKIAHCFCAAVVTAWSALLSAPLFFASASAATCPDIEVTFARATGEPPGVGVVGQEFIDALRSQVGGRSVAIYPVNYPASADFAPSANAGAVDANAHVESMAASCPNTKLVLGGYSLGAAAADVVVAMNQPGFGYTDPLPPPADQHVAAVALFGNATQRVVGDVPGPRPDLAGKVIDLCAPGDPICTGGIQDLHWHSHLQPSYIDSGLVDRVANFVAGRI